MSSTGLYDNRFIADDAIDTPEIADGALSADAAGRALMADDYLDSAATLQAKISTDAFTAVAVADLFAADSIDSDQYAAGSVDGEHISTDGKQVVLNSKFLAAWLQFTKASGTAATLDVNTEIEAAASVVTARNTVSATGILTSNSAAITTSTANPDNYKVQIRLASTNEPVDDGAGGEVYGVLYETGGTVYNVNFYKADDSAYTPLSSVSYDFLAAEIFGVNDLPGTALLTAPSFGDISGGGGGHVHILANITDVSTTEAELDQALDGIGATVTAANLTALTNGSETALHIHDGRYYTETELNAGQLDNQYYTETELGSITGGSEGAFLIGTDASAIGDDAGSEDTVQGVLEAFQSAINTLQAASTGFTTGETIAAESTGAVDTLLADAIDSAPTVGSLEVFLNGARMLLTTHYTHTGTALTWLGTAFPMLATDTVRINYRT